jgi:hypothetical protein
LIGVPYLVNHHFFRGTPKSSSWDGSNNPLLESLWGWLTLVYAFGFISADGSHSDFSGVVIVDVIH